jgi:hypothetical protein
MFMSFKIIAQRALHGLVAAESSSLLYQSHLYLMHYHADDLVDLGAICSHLSAYLATLHRSRAYSYAIDTAFDDARATDCRIGRARINQSRNCCPTLDHSKFSEASLEANVSEVRSIIKDRASQKTLLGCLGCRLTNNYECLDKIAASVLLKVLPR